jgi:hypothetical protein
MTINRVIRIFAGLFVLISLGLGVQGSPLFQSTNWLWFTAFVGLNLFQMASPDFVRWRLCSGKSESRMSFKRECVIVIRLIVL